MRTLFGLLTLVLVSSVALAAPVCVTQSLSDYMALADGCTVGANTFSNFTFSNSNWAGDATWSAARLSSSQITVTPSVTVYDGVTAVVFTFSGPFLLPSGSGMHEYDVNYNLLAAGNWLSGNDLLIGAAVGAAPTSVTLNEDKCVDGTFTGESCSGTVYSLAADGAGGTADVIFTSKGTALEVHNKFILVGIGEGAKGVESFANSFEIPEPLSLILVGSGLLGLGLLRRRYQ